jgi:hypothetical protein
MHDCQKFREDWLDGLQTEKPVCGDCREYCQDATAVLMALDKLRDPGPEVSDNYWADFNSRLRVNLVKANASKKRSTLRMYSIAAVGAAACIVFTITWATLRLSAPPLQDAQSRQPGQIALVDDHIEGLDTQVVDYLGRSELFLRTFTKIEPSRIEDIEDARIRASRNLAGIANQKEAAADFAPVRITLDEYESVLRDIKNMDSLEDIADIKSRIQRNGLIANLKAYQPRVMLVSQQ